jgi:hypothetical protein
VNLHHMQEKKTYTYTACTIIGMRLGELGVGLGMAHSYMATHTWHQQAVSTEFKATEETSSQ